MLHNTDVTGGTGVMLGSLTFSNATNVSLSKCAAFFQALWWFWFIISLSTKKKNRQNMSKESWTVMWHFLGRKQGLDSFVLEASTNDTSSRRHLSWAISQAT